MSDTLLHPSAQSDVTAQAKASRFIWYELMTTDQDAAVRFYSDVVGWTARDHANPEMGGFRYVIVSSGEQGVGGIMQLTDEMCDGGARPGWLAYIGVPDTDTKAREIAAEGGRVLMEPGDIPNVGRFAFVTDPGGAPFYLLTPLPRSEETPLPDPEALGCFSWHELQSSIGEKAAFEFYARHFGWETLQSLDMGPMGTYRIFGGDGVQLGGMMDRPADVPALPWGFYINVDSIDSAIGRIEAGGGTITKLPHQVPDGSWIVHATDPQGAAFALTATTR